MRKLETHDWWSELVSLKDELSLRELAQQFAVTPGAISAAFKRQGITRRPAPPGPRALRRKRTDDDLPPEPGEVVASPDVDLPAPRPGSKDFLIHQHRALLGNVPDAEVATEAGVSVRTVASFRARHKIPPYRGPRRAAAPRVRQSKIDPFADLVGSVPDRMIAKKAGVSLNAVRHYRAKRRIAAVGRVSEEVAVPATAPITEAVEVAPECTQHAWGVTIAKGGSELSRVVLAADVVAAAELARRAVSATLSGGTVTGLRRIGELL